MSENIITIAELEAITTAPGSSFIAVDNGTTTNKITVDNFIASSNQTAQAYATAAESYAKGGTSSRTGENTDNAKYYKEQAQTFAQTIQENIATAEEQVTSAVAAKNSAEGYAGAADSSANFAERMATSAYGSSQIAAGYATSASNSATSANNSAQSASASASDALGYKDTAVGAASDAQGYATDAQGYASAASASADAAAAVAVRTPYVGENGNWFVWDAEENDFVDSGEKAQGDKGDTGNTGATPTISMTATTDAIASPNPSVTVTKSGTDAAPSFAMAFTGLKGPKGDTGSTGPDGYSPAVTISNITGGHTVTITDKDHPSGQSFNVMDGTGAGDMLSSTYDSTSAVAIAGGIAAYVKKSEGRYNVLNYGLVTSAMDEKTADNTAALNALLALVPNGSVIFFPVGIYNFASGITVTKDVTFVGENPEIQTAGNTFDLEYNRPHDPLSILRYTGSTAGTALFSKSGYVDVSFDSLVFDGGNFTVKKNTASRDPNSLKYQYLVESEGVANISGLDLINDSPGTVRNCQFWGFSGFGVRITFHKYIENCAFFWCKTGIVTTFTDSMLHNLWFCKSGTAILMSEVNENPGSNDRTSATVNVSDIWADQLTRHFIESHTCVTSAGVIASNLWIDHVQMSAFYFPNAFVEGARISGSFGRVGMNYAGLQDADRTPAIAVESDFFYCGGYISNSFFELNISNIEGKGQGAGECFSRLFTTMGSPSPNKYNKITCNKFPIARLIDLESIVVEGQTQRRTSNNDFSFTSYFGTDGFIERAGGYDFINGIRYHNINPTTSTWAPAVGYQYYNYTMRALFRCTAIDSANNVFTWKEMFKGTQAGAFPNASPAQTGLIMQYVGTTNTDFTHGCFYECVNHGNNNCSWDLLPVQPVPTALSDLTDDSTHRVVTDTEKSTWSGKSTVTTDHDGTASSTVVRKQRISIDGTYYDIDGSVYMEQTVTLSTSADVTCMFTNSTYISSSSVFDIYTSKWGVNPSAVDGPGENGVGNNSVQLTFAKAASADTITVRIYIR